MSVKLPKMPARIARLPRDERNFPIPWFVGWVDGKPDFRVIGPGKLQQACGVSLCWICGDRLGVHRIYTIGPMCVVNRVTSEPPSHRECAEFAAAACPFLTKPRMRRNDRDLPEDTHIGGVMIGRNPGVVCLYETRFARSFRAGDGVLFRLGDPDRVNWWAEGRRATRAEVWASIESGYPLLLGVANEDGPRAVAELERMRDAAMDLLPVAPFAEA